MKSLIARSAPRAADPSRVEPREPGRAEPSAGLLGLLKISPSRPASSLIPSLEKNIAIVDLVIEYQGCHNSGPGRSSCFKKPTETVVLSVSVRDVHLRQS